MSNYNPCFECANRYNRQYTEKCDDMCDYAKEVKRRKMLENQIALYKNKIGEKNNEN